MTGKTGEGFGTYRVGKTEEREPQKSCGEKPSHETSFKENLYYAIENSKKIIHKKRDFENRKINN